MIRVLEGFVGCEGVKVDLARRRFAARGAGTWSRRSGGSELGEGAVPGGLERVNELPWRLRDARAGAYES